MEDWLICTYSFLWLFESELPVCSSASEQAWSHPALSWHSPLHSELFKGMEMKMLVGRAFKASTRAWSMSPASAISAEVLSWMQCMEKCWTLWRIKTPKLDPQGTQFNHDSYRSTKHQNPFLLYISWPPAWAQPHSMVYFCLLVEVPVLSQSSPDPNLVWVWPPTLSFFDLNIGCSHFHVSQLDQEVLFTPSQFLPTLLSLLTPMTHTVWPLDILNALSAPTHLCSLCTFHTSLPFFKCFQNISFLWPLNCTWCCGIRDKNEGLEWWR